MSPLQVPPRRLLAVLLLALAVAAVLVGGLRLRRWAWDASTSAHFLPDIRNAYRWGRAANRIGYPNLYRKRVGRQTSERNMQLDYPPLRLLIMERWAGWTREEFPRVRRWEPSYEFNAPLLQLNSAFELIAALATFFLVTFWVRHAAAGRAPPGARPWVRGAIAALLVWFNPALIWVAHCWPQWDAWGVAIYLMAALCASLGFWLAVGLVLGVGALLKGQVLVVAALFVLWPLFARNPAGAVRVVLGLFLGIVLGGSPWLLGTFASGHWAWNPPAISWVGGVVLAAVLGIALWKRRNPEVRPAPWLAGAALLALVLCIPLFDADLAWMKIGFLFGSEHFPVLRMGRSPNLPALLEIWVPALQGRATPLLRAALWLVYITGLVACARATARAAREAHPRILAAFAAPWLLSFALLPQMHERYLVYGAVVTAAAAVALRGFVLLHLAVTALAFFAMVPIGLVPDLLRRGGDLHPACALLVLLAAAVCLALSDASSDPSDGSSDSSDSSSDPSDASSDSSDGSSDPSDGSSNASDAPSDPSLATSETSAVTSETSDATFGDSDATSDRSNATFDSSDVTPDSSNVTSDSSNVTSDLSSGTSDLSSGTSDASDEAAEPSRRAPRSG
ncbi:MAG TPA: hypothetical protein VEW48_27675 [Thermoanaerobaculia bacterium]|nr:hypothetical protein [Thermoanaerobaculia bacterium]